MTWGEDAQNSNWGTVRILKTEELIAIANSTRPRDFFQFIPERPQSAIFPIIRQGVLSWLKEPEKERSEKLADVITLNLWAEPANEADFVTTNAGINVWVEVAWGSGGTMMTARVDVGRGTQLVLPADSILCRVGADALPLDGADWTPIPITLNAMVGKYGGQSWKPVRTIYLLSFEEDGDTWIRIPAFAWGIRIVGQRQQLTSAAIIVSSLTSNTSSCTILDTWTALMLKDEPEFFPLSNGAQWIRVTNGSSAKIDLLGLQFALAL